MGKWSQVKCNCPDRVVIAEKGFTEKIYACGHKNGMIIEYWQGDLMRIGHAAAIAFRTQNNATEMLKKLVDTEEYFDEALFFSVEDAELLKLELEEIRQLETLQGATCRKEWQIFHRELESTPFLYGNLDETLMKSLKLCEASIKTKNPIEFYL